MKPPGPLRIGNQTAFSAPPLEPFEYALANGFDAFEWFPDKKEDGTGWDGADLNPTQRQAIRNKAVTSGIHVSLHARLLASPLEPQSQEMLRQDVELAIDLGATLLNVHLLTDHGLADYVSTITPFLQHTSKINLQLAIENTPLNPPEEFNELFARLRALPSAPTHHVGMCLDLGHANLCAATRNDYLKYYDQLDVQVPIIHLHWHENWGDRDTHLPLFTGPAGKDDTGVRGMLKRLRQRHFTGAIILEQWPQPASLLNSAHDRLLALIAEFPAPARKTSPPAQPVPEGQKNLDQPDEVPLKDPGPPPESHVAVTGHAPVGPVSVAQLSGDFRDQLIEGNKHRRSWREKLDFVRELLATNTQPITTDQLVDLTIYLRFLGTGEIACAEDGRHFRPAHHARISLQIQEQLAEWTTPDNAYLIRKLHPWLPSSNQVFQRAEPLTRIRDIAHRNDIPTALKREIKHSLQNKLHRCAGPEDLTTSSDLLERITAPGAGYAPDFVEQFKIFHDELKEFFNARSLAERLQALLPNVPPNEAGLILEFLTVRTQPHLPDQLKTYRLLTDIRRYCLSQWEHQTGPDMQEFLLADTGLEDFAFVLLSEMMNGIEAIGGAPRWTLLLETFLLTITNLALSGLERPECQALESELGAWRQNFDTADRDQLLRLKATVERARRLVEDHCDRVAALFAQRIGPLGRALKVADHAIRTYCEAEIRGHVIFQLAKLVTYVLGRLRALLALPAWDVLVSGTAEGQLKVVASLEELNPDSPTPVIAILKRAEGDEEIPRAVSGLILEHDIPHLSHLGVRARQNQVVLVVGAEPEKIQVLRSQQGKRISLVARPDHVQWEVIQSAAKAVPLSVPASVTRPLVPIPTKPARSWAQLEAIDDTSGGGKASGARCLARLAQTPAAGFSALPGLVVPFGVMEEALHAVPALEKEYFQILSHINELSAADLLSAAERISQIIHLLHVPHDIFSAVAGKFGPHDRLMVRSSANCEDLETLAGAGLYASIANVVPGEVGAAIRSVWASLWSRPALLSRKQAGIPHEHAHMAVLLQPMLTPDLSFILHTVNPINKDARTVYIELALGLGETLASGAIRGTPYRMVCDKVTGAVSMLAFANFSQALRTNAIGGVKAVVADYSQSSLSCEREVRVGLGKRLTSVARHVEEAFHAPQDIEGAMVGDQIFLVQSRPQQGLA